jgi:hypothetical protein
MAAVAHHSTVTLALEQTLAADIVQCYDRQTVFNYKPTAVAQWWSK